MVDQVPDWAESQPATPDWAGEDIKKPSGAPAWAAPPAPVEKPMPGFFEALGQGAKAGALESAQGAEVIASKLTGPSSAAPPKPLEEPSAAAQPYEWKDVLSPSRLAAKTGYGLAKGLPVIGAGWTGAEIGGATAGPWGALGGGAGSAGVAAAVQTIGPAFAEEAQKTPEDLDGAWHRAVVKTVTSGVFSAASWGAFGLPGLLSGPVKNLAFRTLFGSQGRNVASQALAVQPAIGMAEKAALNVEQDKPITEGLGQAYAQSAAGTLVPVAGHRLVAESVNAARSLANAPIAERTPAQVAVAQSAQQKFQHADQLDAFAGSPGLSTDQVYQMRTQAQMERQEAQHETFLSNLPPTLPKLGVLKAALYRNFLPELTSEKARQVAPLFGEYASTKAQEHDALQYQGSKIRGPWDWVPFDDTIKFMDTYETPGAVLDPALRAKYPFMQKNADSFFRPALLKNYFDELDAGSKAEFTKNYFPHMFKAPDQAKSLFENLLGEAALNPGGAGATWFQKARYYDLISHALNNGLELKYKNPVDMVTTRLMSGADMRAKMNLLKSLNQAGVATPLADAPGVLTNSMRMPNPWTQVDAPNGTKWLLAPDVQYLWKNAVESKGLWMDQGIMGRGFRGWMGLKAVYVPLRLGASLFHPVHVAGINLVNNIGRGLREALGAGEQTFWDRVKAVPEAAMQSVMDPLLALPIGTPFRGKAAKTAWRTLSEDWSPEQKNMMDMFRKAGASPQLAEQMRTQGSRLMREAVVRAFGPDRTALERARGLGISIPFQAAKLPFNKISEIFFEHWIPNLKAAALTREAESYARRFPDEMADPVKSRLMLNAIGKQVDNRFGEMFYNALFWNRTIKDAAIGSFLSLGWNLGFAREFVGGALEPTMRALMGDGTPTAQLINRASSKFTNLLLYTTMAMASNAIMTKMFTGEDAQGMDYIFPRVGGNNPDGSPRRLSTPHYTREAPMAVKHVEDEGGNVIYGLGSMLWNKMMFEPFKEMIFNRDYYGGQIFDPTANYYDRAKQFMWHLLGNDITPMSISGAQRAMQLSGKPTDWRSMRDAFLSGDRDMWLPFLGYGPAPSYASRSSIENRIEAYGREFVYPADKPFKEAQDFKARLEATTEYKGARARQDQAGMQAALKKMRDLGLSGTQIKNVAGTATSFQKTFSRLPESIQASLLKDMTKDEFKIYYPKASRKTKADPAIIPMASEYYRRQP